MSRAKNRKRILIVIITPIIAISSIILIGVSHNETISVKSDTIHQSDIEKTIPINGKIQCVNSVIISPEVSGEIKDILFEEGDFVKPGDVIIRINPDLYESMVERSEASLGSALAAVDIADIDLSLAQKSMKRSEQLKSQGDISIEEFEKAESDLSKAFARKKVADYDVLSAQAALKEAQENLRKTSIVAPICGTITKMNVKSGERVVGTSQMAGTEMFMISDLNKMEMNVGINENDVVQVNLNDSVTIEIDAFPGKRFSGYVSKIANSSKNNGVNIEQVSTFEVQIAIDDIDSDGLKPLPGMSATGNIVVEKKHNATTVAITSIFNANGKEFVWIIEENGEVKSREVKSGIRNLNRIEILSGLSKDDRIVVAPYSAITKLTEGVRVKEDEQYNSID